MITKETVVVTALFITLAGFSAWLNLGLLNRVDKPLSQHNENDSDYYLENFNSVGMDQQGQLYRLEAERMVHYPQGDSSLLNKPHIIQYNLEHKPKHIYADSGWLYNNNAVVSLTGNVRVVDYHKSNQPGITTSNKMVVRLKPKQNRG